MIRVPSSLLAAIVFSSCGTAPLARAPVDLGTAIRTLPSEAVAGMSRQGREDYLAETPGRFDEGNRRIHLYNDNPHDGGDAKSMLFLRLFEDEAGRTIAATHAARPQADGRHPSSADTLVLRLEDGEWRDITGSVFPPEVSRDWFFRFDAPGRGVPCGPYEQFERRDGRGLAYRLGKETKVLTWRDGAFHLERNGGIGHDDPDPIPDGGPGGEG